MEATPRYTVRYMPQEEPDYPWAVCDGGEWQESYPTEKQARREAARWNRRHARDMAIEAAEGRDSSA